MFWKNKEKIKQEKLEKLYEEVERYLGLIYYMNFKPNMNSFRQIQYTGNEEFQKSFSSYFANFEKVYSFDYFKNKLTNNEEFVKPMVLKDYMDFFNKKTIKYNETKIKNYTMTKIDGTTFEASDENIDDINDFNVVVWNDNSTELMQKITPNYVNEEKELSWEWDEYISYEDIQNKFIDFKTEEEKILKGEI